MDGYVGDYQHTIHCEGVLLSDEVLGGSCRPCWRRGLLQPSILLVVERKMGYELGDTGLSMGARFMRSHEIENHFNILRYNSGEFGNRLSLSLCVCVCVCRTW